MRKAKLIWLCLAIVAAACDAPLTPPADTPTAPPTSAPAATSTEAMLAEEATPAPTPLVATSEPTSQPTQSAPMLSGAFVNQEVPTSGTYSLDLAAGVLRLNEDFATLPGPDLFVILSGAGDLTLDYRAFSQTVVEAPLLELGPLASRAGAQEYAIPAGTDLSPYKTVVVWCKSFSVAFGAAPVTP